MAERRPKTSTRRMGRAALAVALLAGACSESNAAPPRTNQSDTAAPTPTTRDESPATTTTVDLPGDARIWDNPADGGSMDLGSGARLDLPAGAVTAGARIVTSTGTPGTAALPEMVPVGAAHLIEVHDGSLVGQATIRFALPAPLEGQVPIIATWDGTNWVPAGGTYDPATSSVSIATTHLSWWQPWTWNVGKVVEAAFNGLFGDVDTSEMTCPDGAIGGGYRVALTDRGTAFSGCAATNGDQVTITVKNRRRGAFVIELPAGWTGHVRDALDFSAMLTESLFNMTSRTFVVIPGGETAEFVGTVAPSGQVSMPVSQDLFSWSIDTMLYAGAVFSLGTKATGSTDTLSSVIRQSDDKLSWLRSQLGCLAGNSAWMNAALNNPDSPDAAEDLVPTIWECAKAFARDGGAVSVIAQLVDFALTPIRQLFKLAEMAVDLANGQSNRRLIIARDSAPGTCQSELFGFLVDLKLSDGVSCTEAQNILTEYDGAEHQGSAAGAELSGGWRCGTPSAGERSTIDYDTGCRNDDGRSFTASGPNAGGLPCADVEVDPGHGGYATEITVRGGDCTIAMDVILQVAQLHSPWSDPPELTMTEGSCEFNERPPQFSEAGGEGYYSCALGNAEVDWLYVQGE